MSALDKYPNAFSKFKIKNTVFNNRFVFPGWSLNFANEDGTVSDKLVDFYNDLANNGPGLIITGGAACTSKSLGFDKDFRIYDDKFKKIIRYNQKI